MTSRLASLLVQEGLVAPKQMADAFQRSGGRISATMYALFESPAFQASVQAPNKFKEPVEVPADFKKVAAN